MTKRAKRRPARPDRSIKAYGITEVLKGAQRKAVVWALKGAGFSKPGRREALYSINEALSVRSTRSPGPLRLSEERDDLDQLILRAEDLLDSVTALANQTRLRILGEPGTARAADVEDMKRPLQELIGRSRAVLKNLPADTGGPKVNEADSRFLADLATVWFREFPASPGIVRRGGAAEYGYPMYSGELLNFVTSVLDAADIDIGTPGALGKHMHTKPKGIAGGSPMPSIQEWAREAGTAAAIARQRSV